MKRLIEALKSMGKTELFAVAGVICTLIVLCMNGASGRKSENPDEARMQRLLSEIDGAGRVSVMISRDGDGVVVAASGAGDVRVMLEMQRAVQTLTGLDIDRIEIIKSKGWVR